jgi:hypothetical protein
MSCMTAHGGVKWLQRKQPGRRIRPENQDPGIKTKRPEGIEFCIVTGGLVQFCKRHGSSGMCVVGLRMEVNGWTELLVRCQVRGKEGMDVTLALVAPSLVSAQCMESNSVSRSLYSVLRPHSYGTEPVQRYRTVSYACLALVGKGGFRVGGGLSPGMIDR